jgi:hypothetical protein
LIDAGADQEIKLSNNSLFKIKGFKCEETYSFLDYIFGGCEINVHVAIDFTLSNGECHDKKSLHYLDPYTLTNSYTEAIVACLGILENYSSDKMFPVYGFGGILPDST